MMTDESKAPERIWASEGRYPNFDQGWQYGECANHDGFGGIKYVRADNSRNAAALSLLKRLLKNDRCLGVGEFNQAELDLIKELKE